MKYLLLGVICSVLFSQDANYKDYVSELEKEIGIWVADNAEYKSENETIDQYIVEWKKSDAKDSNVGILYGLSGDKKSITFWEFRKYWDAVEQKSVLLQF